MTGKLAGGSIRVLWDASDSAEVTITGGTAAWTVNGSAVTFPYTLSSSTTFETAHSGTYTVSVEHHGYEIAGTPDGTVEVSLRFGEQHVFEPTVDGPGHGASSVATQMTSLINDADSAPGAALRETFVVHAGEFGVSASNPDNTAALQAAHTAAKNAGGGTILLPAGVIKTSWMRRGPKVTWRGQGRWATVVQALPGLTAHFAGAEDFETFTDTRVDGGSPHGGWEKLTIKVVRSEQPAPLATPSAPTLSTTTGTIAAGTYSYSIAAVSPFGRTRVGPHTTVTLGSAGGVTVSWPAVTGAVGYWIYGRDRWNRVRLAQVGAVTSWTDDGSVTPSLTTEPRSGDLSAPGGLCEYGYQLRLDEVEVTGAAGVGAYFEWTNANTAFPVNGDWSVESVIHDLRVHGCGTEGFVWRGPHDSIADNVVVGFNSQALYNGYDNFATDGIGSPLRVTNSHAFGDARHAMVAWGQAEFINCQGEGAGTSQLFIYNGYVSVIGGDFFWPHAGARGIVVGDADFAPKGISVLGPRLRMFNSATGPALDLTYAGSGGRFVVNVKQDTGTVVQGDPAGCDVHVMVEGSAALALPRRQAQPLHIETPEQVALSIGRRVAAPAAGQVVDVPVSMKNAASIPKNLGMFRFIATDVTDGSEDLDMAVRLRQNGVEGEKLRVKSTGEVSLGAFLSLTEVTDPGSAAPNGARLFVQDNGAGKTQLCVRFATGAVAVLATEP